jgi:hypothetical protein
MSIPISLLLTSLAVLPFSRADEYTVRTARSAQAAGFNLDPVPPPAVNDAAQEAVFALVEGTRDANGAELQALHDGKVPASEDDPASNFFFSPQSPGGRVTVDLKRDVEVRSVATYSWHARERAPQVYDLYAADGKAENFNAAPKAGTDPATCGWKLLAKVDTRAKEGPPGGQHAALVETKTPAKFRHLLFDIRRTADREQFGQTFFSEVDVVDAQGGELQRLKAPERVLKEFPSADGKLKYVVDATAAADLMPWAETELMPVVQEWYPKIVAMLPSEGFTAAREVMLQFKTDMKGVPAYAAGNQVSLNAQWFRRELKREARGSVVHELVHVVQSYWGRARLRNPRAERVPGWVTEGIADYVRWFLYEPQSKGAEITNRNWEKAKHDDSYRTTGNFLDWVIRTSDKELLRHLNAACRDGKYTADLWKERTGKTLEELGAAWRADNAKRLGIKTEEGK